MPRLGIWGRPPATGVGCLDLHYKILLFYTQTHNIPLFGMYHFKPPLAFKGVTQISHSLCFFFFLRTKQVASSDNANAQPLYFYCIQNEIMSL